jgi:hypothetical protein
MQSHVVPGGLRERELSGALLFLVRRHTRRSLTLYVKIIYGTLKTAEESRVVMRIKKRKGS